VINGTFAAANSLSPPPPHQLKLMAPENHWYLVR
jgi:hypothetical protein